MATQRLPFLSHAVIDEMKLSDYLLSSSHPQGRGKAVFFRRFGFDTSSLRSALLEHAANYPVARQEETSRGTRYVIEGALLAPDGRSPHVRVVWFVTTGSPHPHLVTAYPLKE